MSQAKKHHQKSKTFTQIAWDINLHTTEQVFLQLI